MSPSTPTEIVLDPAEVAPRAPGAGTVLLTNRARNPRFAVDADSWLLTASALYTDLGSGRATLPGGAGSSDFAWRAHATHDATATNGTNGILNETNAEACPVDPSTVYTLICDVYAVTLPADARFRIDKLPLDGSFSALTNTGGTLQTLGAGWNRYVDTYTTPAGAVWLRVNPEFFSNTASATHDVYITRVMVVQGDVTASLPDFFDGDMPGTENLEARWSGTPYASSSELVAYDVDRVQLSLNDGAIMVGPDGPDWGDAQIEQYLADQARGQVSVDYRVPNRTISIPLLLGASGPAGFAAARAQLQAKVALFQREGGWIRRASGLYADIIGASLKMPDKHGHLGVEADVLLTLDALPDFYGDELQLTAHTTTTAAELIFTETDIAGDYPARVRLRVDENDGDLQRSLIAAVRSRHYTNAATDRLAYEAEALTPLDAAAVATKSGASGGGSNNVVQHASVGGNWTAVLSTQIAASGHMTHKGTYKVYARAQAPSWSMVLRLVYDVGDFSYPEENTRARVPGGGAFYIVPLGEIRIDPSPVGTHRWQGIIQATSDSGGSDIAIDKVWIVPADEWVAELRAPVPGDPGLVTYSARDEFNQAAGNLTGKPLPVGGTWANVTGGGSGDYTVAGGAGAAERSSGSDSAPRFARAGAAVVFTTVALQVDVMSNLNANLSIGLEQWFGAFARLVDDDNYCAAYIRATDGATLRLVQVIAGTTEVLTDVPISYGADTSYTVRLMVTADGLWYVWHGPAGGVLGEPRDQGRSAALAAGAALDDGGIGLYDYWTGGAGETHTFQNFAAWVPNLDAVLHPSQSAELRTDGIFREDPSGSAYGPVSNMLSGGLPRLPPAGLEDRPVEVFIKASRGDLAEFPDTAIDDIGAQVTYRPCWLFP